MPLLCISLLALLLLPLSLSCDKRRSQEDIKNDYMTLKTHLSNKKSDITTLLQNTSCKEPRHRLPSCASSSDVVSTLHNLTCKIKNLRLSHTDELVGPLLFSIHCQCLERPTKRPNNRRTMVAVTRKRRNEQKKNKTRKLCRAEAILSAMTECYQILNNISTGT